MNTETLFLSRKQHDEVLAADQKLLQRAFRECKKGRPFGAGAYSWSINGVTFRALTPATAAALRAIITKPIQ